SWFTTGSHFQVKQLPPNLLDNYMLPLGQGNKSTTAGEDQELIFSHLRKSSFPSSIVPKIEVKMMHRTFYWSKDVTILIDSWRTTSWTSYSLTLIACLIVSAFYQYLEVLRVRLKTASSSAAKSLFAGADPNSAPRPEARRLWWEVLGGLKGKEKMSPDLIVTEARKQGAEEEAAAA
ncbi:PREDICTED: copper transporter 5, partial [Prunus dulcis]